MILLIRYVMGVCTFFSSIYAEFTMPEVVYKDKYLGMGSSTAPVGKFHVELSIQHTMHN